MSRTLVGAVLAVLVMTLASATSALAQTRAALTVPANRLPASDTAEIASYGGHLTWVDSLPDATGQPQAVVLDRSVGRTVSLALDPAMSDLDLGPGRGGDVIAVFTRCAKSCDVYSYDFGARRESKVAAASRAGVSERRPSIWGTRIAWERNRSGARPPWLLQGEDLGAR